MDHFYFTNLEIMNEIHQYLTVVLNCEIGFNDSVLFNALEVSFWIIYYVIKMFCLCEDHFG